MPVSSVEKIVTNKNSSKNTSQKTQISRSRVHSYLQNNPIVMEPLDVV